MKPLTYLILVLLLASALLPASQPVTAQAPITVTVSFQNGVSPAAGYTGGRDTTIAEARPGAAFAGEKLLRLDGDDPPGTGLDLSTLLYWDVTAIPPGSTVQQVTLEFTVTNLSKGSYSAFEVLQEWVPNQTTWRNRSADTRWQAPGAAGAEDRGTAILGDLAAKATRVSFGFYPDALAVVQKWVDDPASNHGIILVNTNQSDGAALVSSDDSTAVNRPKLTIVYETGAPEPPVGENSPPMVNAGEDFDAIGRTFNLHGAVTDDGLPTDPGQVTFRWEMIFGYPHTQEPTWFTEDDLNTDVGTPTYGRYGFRLTATDGEHTVTDEVYVNVLAEPDRANERPSVYDFGGPSEVRLPNTGTYIPTMLDDGLPMPPGSLTFTWSTASGPAPVTFSDSHAQIVTVTFPEPGTYVLRVEASDGEKSVTGTREVKVLSETLETRTVHFQQGRLPTSSYRGATDTYLSQNAPTTNFGSTTRLRADGDDPPGTGRDLSTLLFWDLQSFPGDPTRITEAAITIYVANPSKGPFYLYALTKAFSENQATWLQAANSTPWGSPGATDIEGPITDRNTAVLAIFKPTGTGFYTAYFTSEGILYLKRALLGSGAGNWGLILTHPDTTDGLDFYSLTVSNAKYRPVLSIRYEVLP